MKRGIIPLGDLQYLIAVIMSRQEIDRILKSDLAELDHTIDHKINSIEQITGQLSEKTNFLAEFQKMLQRELSTMKNTPTEGKASIKSDRKEVEAVAVQQRQSKEILQVKQQLNVAEASLPIKEEPLFHVLQVKETIEIATPVASTRQSEQSQQLKDRLGRHLNAVRLQLEQFKLVVSLLKEEIKAEVDYFTHIVFRDVQHTYTQALNKQNTQYAEQTKLLQKQIDSLRIELALLKQPLPKVDPVKDVFADITFKKLSEENSLNMTQRLREYESSLLKHPRTTTPKPNQLPPSDEWKTCRANLHENIEPPAKFRSKTQKDAYIIPQTKMLSVGVPPVRNGFGVLKIGSKVIYKGMWKEGKFEGSGWLNWEDYCYEGMFSAGCFQGHGRLQFKEGVYVGKFEGNRAEGEGTLEAGGKKVMGIWSKNKLARMF